MKQTFNKDERLKSRTLIGNLFKDGLTIHQYPFKVLYKIDEGVDFKYPAKIAVSVSKRNFKRAVDRNRLKRKIREAYRLNKLDLYNLLNQTNEKIYFFVIYTTTQEISYQEIELGMEKLILRLIDKLTENKT
ncbi:MAG: ribonuclease P protein component [Bacteroidales bacterium]|nr:ribonuclease P protein component [Bacteroidales bacterium]